MFKDLYRGVTILNVEIYLRKNYGCIETEYGDGKIFFRL